MRASFLGARVIELLEPDADPKSKPVGKLACSIKALEVLRSIEDKESQMGRFSTDSGKWVSEDIERDADL